MTGIELGGFARESLEPAMGLFQFVAALLRGPRRTLKPETRPRPATCSGSGKSRTDAASDGLATQITVPVVRETVVAGKAWVIDGDTIVINGLTLRLAGIDAPELDHPYGRRARSALITLCRGQMITAHLDGSLSYDRSVATCYLPDGRDLAAELVKMGLAIDWPKHSGGKYRCLEPADARSRLWRAHARQKGLLN